MGDANAIGGAIDDVENDFDFLEEVVKDGVEAVGTIYNREQTDLFNKALGETQDSNRNLQVNFYRYLSSFDNDKKKNLL